MIRLRLSLFLAWYASKLMALALFLAESAKRSRIKRMLRKQAKAMALFHLSHQAESDSQQNPTVSDKADPTETLRWPPDPTMN